MHVFRLWCTVGVQQVIIQGLVLTRNLRKWATAKEVQDQPKKDREMYKKGGPMNPVCSKHPSQPRPGRD